MLFLRLRLPDKVSMFYYYETGSRSLNPGPVLVYYPMNDKNLTTHAPTRTQVDRSSLVLDTRQGKLCRVHGSIWEAIAVKNAEFSI